MKKAKETQPEAAVETTTKQIKDKLRERKSLEVIKPSDFLSTGSTMLNLACSDRVMGGLLKGCYYLLVGDSASGKTWLSLNLLAEASINKNFDDYSFIYDSAEYGALMDISRYFGTKLSDRIEPPSKNADGSPDYSSSIEEFYYSLSDRLDKGKPIIWIEDSMDSLTSEDESAKFEEHKEAFRKGKDSAGSYGDGKAKKNSANLRRMLEKLKKTGSILIIISQTRDNLGFGFDKKTRSGGKALRFYSHSEVWTSIKGVLKKTVAGKERQIGIICKMDIKKNRETGKLRSIEVPIYHSYGMDDIGSMIDYLEDEGHWGPPKKERGKAKKVMRKRKGRKAI